MRTTRRAVKPHNHEATAEMRVGILKSAAKAFRRNGYHGATVEEIASELRMKKGNLYYYFKNKEDILYSCHDYSLDRLLDLLHEVERSNLYPDGKLRKLILGVVHTMLDELHGTALMLDLEALTPAHLKAVIIRRDDFDHGVRRLLEAGIKDGTFSQGSAKLRAFAIFGAINWIPRWFNPDGPASTNEIADQFADYLVTGLRPT
jgi:AcrR family transcriptional regulator